MSARRLGLALAVVLAATPAAAYVRTADSGTGKVLSWPLPTIAYHLNRDWPHTAPSCEAKPAGDPTLDAVRASFAQWEQGCADLHLVYAGEVGDIQIGSGGSDENVVVFRGGWCSQHPQAKNDPCMTDPDVDCGGIYGCFEDSSTCIGKTTCADWGIVALTSVLYDPRTGRVFDADIEVNGWDGVAGTIGNPPQHGWYFTCYPGTQPAGPPCSSYAQNDCSFIDLQNTVTHEAGHFVGLAHTTQAGATMVATTAPREIDKRDLSADDVAGVCAIYPQPSGGCGCGAVEGTGASSLLVLALALRPRRRRAAAFAAAGHQPSPAPQDTTSPA